MHRRVAFLLALACATFLSTVSAQEFPNKRINLIVPYGPGGSSDLIGRFVADTLTKEFGQPTIVVNKPGAAGNVGWRELIGTTPDGYTIAILTKSLTIQKYTTPGAVYYADLDVVAKLVTSLGAIAVHRDSPYKTVKDLVDAAKKAPGTIGIANSGSGGTWDLFAVLLERSTGATFIRVPFKGGSPAVAGVVGGHVQATAMDLPTIATLLGTERIRLLGINANRRLTAFPEIPTLSEQGVDMQWDHWTGIGAPKGTPRAAMQRLSSALKKMTETPEWKSFVEKNYYTSAFVDGQEWSKELAQEDAQLKKLTAGLEFKQ